MSNNRIALITGANRGIGLEIVRQLAAKGYETILTSRSQEKGEQALKQLPDRENIHFHTLDITDSKSVEAVKNDILKQFGRLDILINNAGINYDSWHDTQNANLEETKETMDTNLFGAWRMALAFIPIMKENGFGRIVNVSSGLGALKDMEGGAPGYGISKAAMNALTIKLGKELQDTGILVNSVCPGWVRTDMGGSDAPRSVEQGAKGIIWAAELSDNGPTAKFFRDSKEIDF